MVAKSGTFGAIRVKRLFNSFSSSSELGVDDKKGPNNHFLGEVSHLKLYSLRVCNKFHVQMKLIVKRGHGDSIPVSTVQGY